MTKAANDPGYLVAALYKFVALDDWRDMQPRLQAAGEAKGIVGSLLLAREGINGTIAGREADLRAFLDNDLLIDARFAGLSLKESHAAHKPFRRLKVRLKKEIVTMGVDGIDPRQIVGTYVKPADWNALIDDPDVVVIDTRNDYEVAIGTFEGAVNPNTRSFREFPAWAKNYQGLHNKPKVAMFCTGGIRCEKSTAWMKEQGFDEVYHLEGGILKYLEEVPAEESRWQGECFVFDERVSVSHGLKTGDYTLCRGCRRPLSAEDRASPLYEEGITCPHCHDELSDDQKARFAERQRQMRKAREEGYVHLGAKPEDAQKKETAADKPRG
ncbi:rhodanese-related sulfurtransferase [Gimibacter soli]|uniref:tRNA uridine(34) hydroxylase n=1 Tax=Gimibacter soli TaxID=3024400 RepID=A0AAE9XPK3_9PROT|nr:rhodanese-related sulfurtransferase [Gimibacter soli]WCL54807.1 rhodanese-related sulfurtransferase [Gimibacter soli]